MKLTIVRSEAYRQARAIVMGVDAPAEITVHIDVQDIPMDLRPAFCRTGHYFGDAGLILSDGTGYLGSNYDRMSRSDTHTTQGDVEPDAPPEAIWQAVRDSLARVRQAHQELVEKNNVDALAWAAQPVEARIEQKSGRWTLASPGFDWLDAATHELYQRAQDEATAEVKIRNEALVAEKKAAEVAEEAETEVAVGRLQAWAMVDGSELLQARLAGGFFWKGLARLEFARRVCPEGFRATDDIPAAETPDVEEPRTTPSLAELVALQDMTKNLQPPLENPRLLWNKIKKRFDEDTEEEIPGRGWPSLDVDIRCPDGEILVATRTFDD